MEILTETEPQTEVKHLIHQDDQQTARTIEEATNRKQLLNGMLDAGIPTSEIDNMSSQFYIDQYLFDRHLELNKSLAQEYAAGKRADHLVKVYILPPTLEHLKGAMEAWANYPFHGQEKFRHLKLKDGRYQLNQETIEKEFEIKKLKLFVGQNRADEIKFLDSLVDYLVEQDMPLHQLPESTFWAKRFTRDPSQACNRLRQGKVMIKKSYLVGKD